MDGPVSVKSYYETCAIPKGEPRKRLKGRKDRAEYRQRRIVRAQCVERDGSCRLSKTSLFGDCWGFSEWMHLGEKKRCKTRGMAPEARHTTAGSLMGCTRHHRAYDAGRLKIEPLTERGADGTLKFSANAVVAWVE